MDPNSRLSGPYLFLKAKGRRDPDYRAIHEVADSLVPALRRAFLDAVAAIQDDVSIRALAAALERRDVNAAIQILGVGALAERLRGMRQDARANDSEMRTLGGHLYFLFKDGDGYEDTLKAFEESVRRDERLRCQLDPSRLTS